MKKLLFTLGLILNVLLGYSQTTIRVEVPNLVAVDEQFNLTFILEGEDKPTDFEWNSSSDFRLVYGPQQGVSRNIQIIQGKRTTSVQYTYTYTLMAEKSGVYNIPIASAKVNKKSIKSKSVKVEVVSNSSSSSSSSGQRSNNRGSSSSVGISDDDLFLNFVLDKTNVVLGEPIIGTLKLYQRVSIGGFEDAIFPKFNGFWSQEIETPSNIEFKRESYNDKIYNTAVIRKYMLIPQQIGQISIDAAELICLVNVHTSSGARNIFDSFLDSGYQTIRKRIRSRSYKVNVRSLPANTPASFGGGVGKFSISAKLTTDSLKVHEAASLILTVSGRGNVSLLEPPKPVFPPDVEVYDTKISENIDKSSGGISGTKTYEFPLIPRSHGDFIIEPIKYAYYDISAKKYVVLETDPIDFSVAKINGIESGVVVPSISNIGQKSVKNLGEDIRFIETKMPRLKEKGAFFVGTRFFYVLIILFIFISVVIWFSLRKLALRRADVVGAKTRKATKMALSKLKLAENLLKKNSYSDFYEELHKALVGYVSDKLNITLSELSHERIENALAEVGISSELIAEYIEVLNACELARYSPVSSQDEMNIHYEKAIDIISTIDSNMKTKNITKSRSNKALALAFLLLSSTTLSIETKADTVANTEVVSVDSLWISATNAYSAGEWTSSVANYTAILDQGLESPELYTNLANSYFKNNDLPHAILNYERALKLDPSYDDAKYNLEICNSLISDKIDVVPEFLLKTWSRNLCYIMDSNGWTILFLVFLAILAGSILFFLLSKSRLIRKVNFYKSIVFFLLMITSLIFSLWQRNDYRNSNSAIIISPVVSVKSSPSTGGASKELFILHEGTKVTILDSVGDWDNVELGDGRSGWIDAQSLDVI